MIFALHGFSGKLCFEIMRISPFLALCSNHRGLDQERKTFQGGFFFEHQACIQMLWDGLANIYYNITDTFW